MHFNHANLLYAFTWVEMTRLLTMSVTGRHVDAHPVSQGVRTSLPVASRIDVHSKLLI